MSRTKSRKVRRTPRKVVLPKKMSSLIGIALKDLAKVEKSEKYLVDMGTWHEPQTLECRLQGSDELIEQHEKCVLCFAGAVMAGTLKASPDENMGTHSFGSENEEQLDALDELRQGHIQAAANILNIIADWEDDGSDEKRNAFFKKLNKCNTFIPDYDRGNSKPFHTAMAKLQGKLKAQGL